MTKVPEIVSSQAPILLVGGGYVDKTDLEVGLALADRVVAADGGAAALLAHQVLPDAVIGDLDSLCDADRAALPPSVIHHIAEQDSTDFDKCLRSINSPMVLAAGFLGKRMDHSLAALTVLTRHPDRRCILMGQDDVITLCPPALTLDLPAGTRVSLFPMAEVTGRSTGLHWPIEGITFRPDALTGTSNHADGPVSLWLDQPAMLLILPRTALDALHRGLSLATARWPAPSA